MIPLMMVALEQVRVATPCGEDWEAMDGDDRRRFCAGCGCHVHNLSAMSRAEAQALVNDHAVGGRLCVRYHPRSDGAPMTREDVLAAPSWMHWTRRWAAAASWAVALLTAGLIPARANVTPRHPKPAAPAPSRHVTSIRPTRHTLGHIVPRALRPRPTPPAVPAPPPATMGDVPLPPPVAGGLTAAPPVQGQPTLPPRTMGKIAYPTRL